ncbi:MAG: CinA family nicotinamide mononucleotide deamidase-related protein, partial [Planctomycetaceae bacterium]|nr:CinA family nicotinamide mononucleotide deamidase-related protein [Planctomycetaceae bacterium]
MATRYYTFSRFIPPQPAADNPAGNLSTMIGEVISIGDELTSGQRLDTNSQWLSTRLTELGVRVRYHTTVADDLGANVQVFRAAADRADVVVATGGLGPTADDLTREALADVSGQELELHEDVLEFIRGLFARFSREMPERNRVQALFPRGSRVIPNPNGTAPGIDITIPRADGGTSRIFALPGVPAEMFPMFDNYIAPAIGPAAGVHGVIRHRRIKCFGAGESHIEQMLPDIIRRGRDPAVGITVSEATITLRITAHGKDEAECLQSMEPTVATIYQCLGYLAYGEEEDEIEDVVSRLLTERNLTLATVEWGTAGLVSERLCNAPGGRQRHAGGFVISNAAEAERLLGVPARLAEGAGAVSGELVEALARAARERTGADLALAVSALPVVARSGTDSPKVFIGLATGEGVTVRSAPCFGDPSI